MALNRLPSHTVLFVLLYARFPTIIAALPVAVDIGFPALTVRSVSKDDATMIGRTTISDIAPLALRQSTSVTSDNALCTPMIIVIAVICISLMLLICVLISICRALGKAKRLPAEKPWPKATALPVPPNNDNGRLVHAINSLPTHRPSNVDPYTL